jgi:alcohol dehydrogenase class IV
MSHSFTFTAMPQLIVGPDSIGRLGKTAASFGRTALLVTGARARSSDPGIFFQCWTI